MSRYVDADALKKRIREEYLPDDDEETEMEQIVMENYTCVPMRYKTYPRDR